ARGVHRPRARLCGVTGAHHEPVRAARRPRAGRRAVVGRSQHHANDRHPERPAAGRAGGGQPRRQGPRGLRSRRRTRHSLVCRQGALGQRRAELSAVRHRGRGEQVPRRSPGRRRHGLPRGTGRFGMTTHVVADHVLGVVSTPSVARPRRITSRWQSRLLRLASVAAAIGLWQLLTADKVRLLLRFDTLPTVTEIVNALHRRLGTGEYWLDLAQSLIRILTGFGLAAVIGVATGVLLARSRLFAGVFGPLAELARPIPAIAMVPVAILLFPPDEAGIVFS